MGWLVLIVLPAVFFVLLDLLIFGQSPPWLRLPSGLREAWRRRRERPGCYDPFDTLHVQHRLAALAAEIQRLEADGLVFAKAHRIRVAESAYDALLAEACRLAGVEPLEFEVPSLYQPVPHERRVREELALASRGWFW
ncbi:MAG TPA: hypothetical protein VI248_15495 [Kineosporiaceae bacterium]